MQRNVAEYFLRTVSGCATLDRVLPALFVSEGIIPGVEALAKDSSVSLRTLERHWKDNRPGDCELTLRALREWALLLRAWAEHRPSRSIESLAMQLEIHSSTLTRLSRRLTGLPCREFLGKARGEVWRIVEHQMFGGGGNLSETA